MKKGFDSLAGPGAPLGSLLWRELPPSQSGAQHAGQEASMHLVEVLVM